MGAVNFIFGGNFFFFSFFFSWARIDHGPLWLVLRSRGEIARVMSWTLGLWCGDRRCDKITLIGGCLDSRFQPCDAP
jgi:hypothetical protein